MHSFVKFIILLAYQAHLVKIILKMLWLSKTKHFSVEFLSDLEFHIRLM